MQSVLFKKKNEVSPGCGIVSLQDVKGGRGYRCSTETWRRKNAMVGYRKDAPERQ